MDEMHAEGEMPEGAMEDAVSSHAKRIPARRVTRRKRRAGTRARAGAKAAAAMPAGGMAHGHSMQEGPGATFMATADRQIPELLGRIPEAGSTGMPSFGLGAQSLRRMPGEPEAPPPDLGGKMPGE